jgi:two-component system phosphate regulon sensor histidine kinase PhoR
VTRTLARRYLAYAAAIAATALILGVFSGSLVRAIVQRDTYTALAESALLVERVLESAPAPVAWDELADRLGSPTLRLTFIRDDGVVLGDSRADPRELENHANRDEVSEALAGRKGQATRRSASVGEELAYVTLPVRTYQGVRVVVRASAAVAGAHAYVFRARLGIGLVALAALIVVTLATYLAERRMIEPIQKLQRAASAYAEGRFDYGLHVTYPPDLAQVAA